MDGCVSTQIDLTSLEDQIKVMTSTRNELDVENDTLRSDLATAQRQIASLEEQIENAQALAGQHGQAAGEAATLRQQNSELSQQMHALQQELSTKDQQLTKTARQLKSKSDEYAAAQAQAALSGSTIADLQAMIQKFRDTETELRSTIESMTFQIEGLS